MGFETYKQLYIDKNDGITIRPMGEGAEFKFSLLPRADKSYRLFVTGQTELFFHWKNEPFHPTHYHSPVDALDSVHAWRAQYCLDFSMKKPEKYIKRVYKKVVWNPKLSYLELIPVPDEWEYGISVRAEGLKIHEGGYMRMRLAVRYKHDGVNKLSVENAPDAQYITALPEGSYGWQKLCEKITLPHDKIASVGVFIEGVGYEGTVYVEKPYLTELQGGHNVIPDFTTPVSRCDAFDWSAQHMSRKEWPEFRVTLNGAVIFEGERFERCHVNSEWEISLPRELIKEENTLKIELISEYHDPLPYTVHELGIIEQTVGEDFALLAVSKAAPSGGKAYALIRTNTDSLTLKASYAPSLSGNPEFKFERAGLHGISFNCLCPTENAEFTLSSESCTAHGKLERGVLREDDGVITGTGDFIYVNLNREDAEEFLIWYVSEGIGNLMTLRPAYRWSGTRIPERGVWEDTVRVLNELGIKYANMIDGRELSGMGLNPDLGQLEGEGNLGKQNHELDGAMFYWGRHVTDSANALRQYNDMVCEAYKEENPEHANRPVMSGCNLIYHVKKTADVTDEKKTTAPVFDGDKSDTDTVYQYKDPTLPQDTREAYKYTVERIRHMKSESAKRHTGPSVMFKYMMDGGFDWVGAETMYTSHEPLLAFLRGTTLSRGGSSMGVHNALQWSSSPHDAEEHVRRYRLALYSSYMQGITEINTEEGLWRLEEYYSDFHRFSDTCVRHKLQQQDFYSYVSTHTRRGRFHTPVGILQGRYDGWHSFSSNSTWSFDGVSDGDSERSWELLKTVYPESNLGNSLYFHNCPTDIPLGYYSATPMGNIDAIPVETAAPELLDGYRMLAFAGYNCYDEADFKRLHAYVKRGGKLLLTRAHMTSTTLYSDISGGKLSYSENVFSFTNGTPDFAEEHVGGVSVRVCKNYKTEGLEALSYTDEGTPLLCKYTVENGCVMLLNADAYPAHPAIKDIYFESFKSMMLDEIDAEYAWAYTGDKVETAVYMRDDGSRDIYFLAVDWYNRPTAPRRVTLRIAEERYTVTLPFGVMKKCTVKGGVAVLSESESAEVISIENGIATLQGTGACEFVIFKNGSASTVTVDFSASPVQKIEI